VIDAVLAPSVRVRFYRQTRRYSNDLINLLKKFSRIWGSVRRANVDCERRRVVHERRRVRYSVGFANHGVRRNELVLRCRALIALGERDWCQVCASRLDVLNV
jgi:hypothetical protein